MNDSQKYKLIFWYFLLKDIKEYNLQQFIQKKLPCYEIDWCYMAHEINQAANSVYKRKKASPWSLYTKRKDGLEECCNSMFVLNYDILKRKYVGKYI